MDEYHTCINKWSTHTFIYIYRVYYIVHVYIYIIYVYISYTYTHMYIYLCVNIIYISHSPHGPCLSPPSLLRSVFSRCSAAWSAASRVGSCCSRCRQTAALEKLLLNSQDMGILLQEMSILPGKIMVIW